MVNFLIAIVSIFFFQKAKPVMPGRKKDAKKQGTNVSWVTGSL